MSRSHLTAEERYAALVETLGSEPNVTRPSDAPGEEQKFGSAALKVNAKIFAMLVRGKLVVKLPRQRVEALIASGGGERFDPGTGRLMKEWLSLEPASDQDWLTLAREAMEFVASRR
jgi:hypothetical protein